MPDNLISPFEQFISSQLNNPFEQARAIQADELSWLALSVAIAVCALLIPSLPGAPRVLTFLLMMIVFVFSTFLLVSTNNLLGFLFLWEFTALSAWGIGKLGLRGSNPVLGALPVNAVGSISSMAMFAFVALTIIQSGSLEMGDFKSSSPSLAMALLLVAILLKVFGLVSNAWVEGNKVAFPVSNAILAGGAVTVVGLYPFLRFGGVLIRLSHDAQSLALWTSLVVALLFALVALQELDLYRIASLLTFSQFCLALAGLSVINQQSISGALFTVITYAFATVVLFLAMGIVCESSSARSLTRLGGLMRERPALALVFLVAILAASPLPPFGTFVGKITASLAMIGYPDPLVGIAWMASWTVTALFMFRALAMTLFPSSSALHKERVHVYSIIPVALGISFLIFAAIWPNLLLSFLQPAISKVVG